MRRPFVTLDNQNSPNRHKSSFLTDSRMALFVKTIKCHLFKLAESIQNHKICYLSVIVFKFCTKFIIAFDFHLLIVLICLNVKRVSRDNSFEYSLFKLFIRGYSPLMLRMLSFKDLKWFSQLFSLIPPWLSTRKFEFKDSKIIFRLKEITKHAVNIIRFYHDRQILKIFQMKNSWL